MQAVHTLTTAFNTAHTTGDTTRDTTGAAKRPSLAKRIFDALVAGQERRARAQVHAYLARHDDATLAGLGWSAAEIARLRRTPSSFMPLI